MPRWMRTTENPARCRLRAHAVATMRPPMTAMSRFDGSIQPLGGDPPCERIAVVDHERSLQRDVRRSANERMDAAVAHLHGSMEDATQDSLLAPFPVLRKLAVGVQAGQLGAGARPARRPVVGIAGAQHEVARIGMSGIRGTEELDVIDLRAAFTRDGLTRERLANPGGERRELLEI